MSGLRDAIKSINKQQSNIVVGVVKSVDINEMTCEVAISNDEDVITTSLVVGDANKGVIQIPKIGSNVVVLLVGNMSGFVTMVEQMDKVIINGGSFGGIVKIEELKKNLENIKSYIEALKEAVNGGINAVGAGSAANGATGASAFVNAMNGRTIEIKDMEDKVITH